MSLVIANVSCVAVRGRAILIEGSPGSGKSSLALALIDRGAVLVGDDAISVTLDGGHPQACPPPNTAGKLEIRNVGIVDLPAGEAPLALILELGPEAPRFPLEVATGEICGVAIPRLRFAPGDAVQALRAEFALEKHGLPVTLSPGGDGKQGT